MSVDIAVLGGTTVRVDGVEQDLGGRRPAEVLALLVAAEGAPVDADVLADRLWRGDPPASARTTLQGYVARLRRVLEPGRAAREATLLQSRGTAYRLDVPDDAVDVRRFTGLLEEAADRRASGDVAGAVDALRSALRSWAPPYPDVADVVDVGPVVARLEEQHLRAVEDLATLRLDAPGGADPVADLVPHARAHPLRERLQLLLARALYQEGRQAEALDVLRSTRERLAEELGLDASEELRDLERAILRQDALLGAPSPVPPPAGASPSGPPVATAAPDRVFVGREDALAVLDRAWQQARSGHSCVVVVTGEPGIGKTALVDAFLGRHPDVPARRARCLSTPGVPPYWLWQQLVGGLPATSIDAGARFALAIDLTRQLQQLADRPLVVTVDDLQWADEDSVHVLEVVLDQLGPAPVLVLLTVREEATADPALTTLLARVARLPGSARVPLTGLSREEVGELVRRTAGSSWSPEALADLAERSAGNPFFVGELASRGSTDGLPAGVRDVLRLRVAGLSRGATGLVELVAVAGRDVAPGFAATVLDLRPGELDDAVEEAVRHGVLVRTAADRLAFGHDLQREVLLDDLGAGRRATLHARLADALSKGPAALTSQAAIAVHRSEAAEGATSEDAATSCLAAAEEAYGRAGHAEARDFARRGLGHAPPGSAVRGDLQQVLGRALRRLGLLEESREAMTAAFELARSHDDAVRMGHAALSASGAGLGGYWGAMAAILHTDDALLTEAVAASDRMPAALRSSLLSALAVQRAAIGHPAADLAAQALAAAGDDREARARARVAEYVALWTPAHAEHRLALSRRLLEESADDPMIEATALHLYRCALLETDHPDEAAAASRRFTELVTRRGDGDQMLLDLWWQVGLALARGDFDRARRTADEAVAAAPTVSPAAAQIAEVSRQTVHGIIAWHERRLPQEMAGVVDLATNMDADWLTVLAQAHAQAGRRTEALAAVDRLLEQPRAATREPVRVILLADLFLELGEADRAAELLPVLETYGDTVVVLWVGLTVLGPVSLYRGGIKALLGAPDAREELERAVALSERHGFAPFADRARRLLGGPATVGLTPRARPPRRG